MLRSGCRFLLTGKLRAPQCGQNNFRPVIFNVYPVLFMIENAWEQASVSTCPGSHLYVFNRAAKKRALSEIPQTELVTNLAFFILIGHGHLHYAGAGREENSCLCHHAYLSHLMILSMTLFVLRIMFLFPFRSLQPIPPMLMMTMIIFQLRVTSFWKLLLQIGSLVLALPHIWMCNDVIKYQHLCPSSNFRNNWIP